MSAPIARAIALAGALAASSGCGVVEGDVLTIRGRAAAGPFLPPVDHAWLGADVGTRSGQTADQALAALETEIGRKLDVRAINVEWGSSLVLDPRPGADVAAGRIPMIFWEGANSGAVVAGQYDDYARAFAASLYALRAPVLLVYGAKMDQRENWVVSPDAFKAAWLHLRGVFDAFSPDLQAYWVYAPSKDAFAGPAADADAFYPGDQVVDYHGAIGFNWFQCSPATNPTWSDFDAVFQPAITWATAHDTRPFAIVQTGTQEDPNDPGRKAAWLDQARARLGATPVVRAFVYFHEGLDCQWWVDSSAASLQAFVRIAQSPHFTH